MTIFDQIINDVMTKSYRGVSTDQNLQKWENLKKPWRAHRSFIPLVFSTEGCTGKETQAAVRRLAKLISKKWDRE